jgi:hypothetical protein
MLWHVLLAAYDTRVTLQVLPTAEPPLLSVLGASVSDAVRASLARAGRCSASVAVTAAGGEDSDVAAEALRQRVSALESDNARWQQVNTRLLERLRSMESTAAAPAVVSALTATTATATATATVAAAAATAVAVGGPAPTATAADAPHLAAGDDSPARGSGKKSKKRRR